jgi:hypothetical protein
MQLKILRGETMNNPVIRKKLLGEWLGIYLNGNSKHTNYY